MTKITIITPSFNQGEYLEENIQSVLKQDHQQVEHIIIDGGSSDNSPEILSSYGEQLTYWVSEPDKGQTHAINKGIAQASGDIITWINSDDQLELGALSAVAAAFDARPDVGIVFGKCFEDHPGKAPIVHAGLAGDKGIMGLAGMAFPQPASFFRASLLSEYGLPNESLEYGMDYDLFVRFILNEPILEIDKALARYRFHDSSKSNLDPGKFAEEWAWIFSKVLRSINGAEHLISEMKFLNLYKEGDDKFLVKEGIAIERINKAFYYMLYFQIVFLYENLQTERVNLYASYIKKHNPEFMKSLGLERAYWRSKLIPKPILAFVRSIIR